MAFLSLRGYRAPARLTARLFIAAALIAGGFANQSADGQSSEANLQPENHARVAGPIDEHALTILKNNVRRDVARAADLGPVEDSLPMNLFLVIKRSPAQEADLENLIERQQQPTAREYHQWLTPKQFGARFGANADDIAKLSSWLESHGFTVREVLNNASLIDFAATAGQVREAFHTQLHYVQMHGGRFPALVHDPAIPAALAPVIAGIRGLTRIPPRTNHTAPRIASYDADAHRWQAGRDKGGANPEFAQGGLNYFVGPQDFYTIYNVKPVFTGNELAAKATVAVIEESDMEYGTVNSTTHVATGSDLATFRKVFGVPGTLNLHVYHGYGSVKCTDPGVDPKGTGEDIEASLDAEWMNATAPSANLIFMSCDDKTDQGIFTSMAALIDNNVADTMSLSYGESELNWTSASDYSSQDTLFAQAATQGQSIFVAAGDSGSDVNDDKTSGTAVSGINVNAFGSPMVTVAGGTDFSDLYDAGEGGPAQSEYWSSTNSATFGDALSYVPETAWNESCASSLLAAYDGYSGAGLCGAEGAANDGYVVGGSGGISTHYAVPSWQTGISGYANSMHAQPDISGFASSGGWGHALLFCDSHQGGSCASSASFDVAGGTSFVAPYLAGIAGLLVDSTGSRQGLLNPALYALAKAQYASQKTACYANGQAANSGVTKGLPVASCIFNDVTTGNNDVPCAAGTTGCYVNSGQTYGMLSLKGASSLSVAYPSAAGFDEATGIGTVNVANLLAKWNTAFTSTTTMSAQPTNITASQSTVLQAGVSGGGPAGYVGTLPVVTGSVSFKAGSTALGSCTLSSGKCSTTVAGTLFQSGSNSVTATFTGSSMYPSSTSSITTVTVASTLASMTAPTPNSTLTGPNATFSWTTDSAASGYALWVGSTGVGSANVYEGGVHNVTSLALTGLPCNGGTLYVRLWSSVGGTLAYNDYTYTEAREAAMSSPSPGGTLPGPSVTFSWAAGGSSATGYALWAGTTGVGSANLLEGGFHTATSATVSGLPTNGGTVYVRLWTSFNGATVSTDYTYTSATRAVMLSPSPSTALAASSVTFSWAAGVGNASGYALWVGTTGVGSSNLLQGGLHTTTSASVNGLPMNGATVYARLFTSFNGTLVYTDYVYTAAKQAVMSSPSQGSTLTGSTVTFKWNAGGSTATGYALWVGTTGAGSANVYEGGVHATTSAAVSGLPTNGKPVYVRLWTSFNGTLFYNDYAYTAK